MRSDEFLWKVCVEIYVRAFQNSIPKLDFNKVYERVQKGEKLRGNWFLKFFIPEDKFDEIVSGVCRKYKLSKVESEMVRTEVYLGCSPTSSRERWIEEWGGKEPNIKVLENVEELFEVGGGVERNEYYD